MSRGDVLNLNKTQNDNNDLGILDQNIDKTDNDDASNFQSKNSDDK